MYVERMATNADSAKDGQRRRPSRKWVRGKENRKKKNEGEVLVPSRRTTRRIKIRKGRAIGVLEKLSLQNHRIAHSDSDHSHRLNAGEKFASQTQHRGDRKKKEKMSPELTHNTPRAELM